MPTYIEIVKHSDGSVVHKVDVSLLPPHRIDKCELGININLNHEEYYTRVSDCNTATTLQHPNAEQTAS